MAQNAVGKLFCRQSCFRQSSFIFKQARSYSKDAIPTFSATSSPELDRALNHFRENLFIPFGLNSQQRKLIFKKKYTDRLKEQPVTLDLGNDEKYQLRPIQFESLPTKEDTATIMRLMKTTHDWQNLIPFLKALRSSRRFLNSNRWEWLVRKAAAANALGIILECAKQSDRTGLHLRDVNLVRHLFFGIHVKAQETGFQGTDNAKALTLAQQAVVLMESPKHATHDVSLDPKRRPFVIGVLLELSAARALNESEGEDVGGIVRSYAERLLATWPLGSFSQNASTWPEIDAMLQENIPIWNGMKLALQIKGIASNKALHTSLTINHGKLRKLIAQQLRLVPENAKERPTTGLRCAHRLFEE